MRASRRPEVGCHRGKLRLRENRRNFSKTPDIGSCPARGEGSNPSSRSDLSGTVRLRQNHANYKGKPSSTPVDPIPSSRQYQNEYGSIRPHTATQKATRLLPNDPGLAAVVDAWPDLPEAIRAGILAMIGAGSGKAE